jgi:hypothetical protein
MLATAAKITARHLVTKSKPNNRQSECRLKFTRLGESPARPAPTLDRW